LFILIHGSDQLRISESLKSFVRKYRTDDFNYVEFDGKSDLAEMAAAMQQAPLLSDYFMVVVNIQKGQLQRVGRIFTPSDFTVLVLICDGFSLTDEQIKDLRVDQVVDCRPMRFGDLVKWIKSRASEYGFSMDLDDRKRLALLYQSTKEIEDVLFQMSMLNDFDRRVYFNDLFKTRQEFVWNLFTALQAGDHKLFFRKYAEQLLLNSELSKSQFDMKIVGGLLFCLGRWEDSPEWIKSKLQNLEENGERLLPFLHSHLIEILVMARKEQSNIPLLMRFVSIMHDIKDQKF